jgi:hypothetical protein
MNNTFFDYKMASATTCYVLVQIKLTTCRLVVCSCRHGLE